MEQLSSCYFCGAALDAQIEPYQVIPPQLDPDSGRQRAVSLCPSCRQKLANVVETVVGATDAEAASAVDDVTPVEPEEPLLDEPEADASDSETTDADRTDDDAETAAEAESAASRDPDNRGESIERADSGQSTAGTERQTETATGRPGDRSTQSDPLSSDRSDETDEGQSATHANPAGQSRDDTDQSAATETSTASDESATDDAEPSSDDGPSLTALEYNKVMRLLQNREFPVERAEIHEIATSAYQVSDREFDAIIDAAIERGLLDEENGQLVSASE